MFSLTWRNNSTVFTPDECKWGDGLPMRFYELVRVTYLFLLCDYLHSFILSKQRTSSWGIHSSKEHTLPPLFTCRQEKKYFKFETQLSIRKNRKINCHSCNPICKNNFFFQEKLFILNNLSRNQIIAKHLQINAIFTIKKWIETFKKLEDIPYQFL